jgi:hypothetical protein
MHSSWPRPRRKSGSAASSDMASVKARRRRKNVFRRRGGNGLVWSLTVAIALTVAATWVVLLTA